MWLASKCCYFDVVGFKMLLFLMAWGVSWLITVLLGCCVSVNWQCLSQPCCRCARMLSGAYVRVLASTRRLSVTRLTIRFSLYQWITAINILWTIAIFYQVDLFMDLAYLRVCLRVQTYFRGKNFLINKYFRLFPCLIQLYVFFGSELACGT